MTRNSMRFSVKGSRMSLTYGEASVVFRVDWEITADSLLYVNKISAFVGMKGKGIPVCTILRGKVAAKDGRVTGEKGAGMLVKRID